MRPLRLMLPEGLEPSWSRVLQIACEQLHSELGDSMVGLLIGGSLGRGQADPTSDIDLFVPINDGWFQRRRPHIEGREIDIFIDGKRRLHDHMAPAGNAVIIRSYAGGTIIYDPERFVSDLKRRAQATLAGPRRPPSDGEEFKHVQQLRDGLRTFLRALDGPDDLAAYHLSRLVMNGLGTFCVFGHRWHNSEKQMFNDIAASDPYMGALISKLISLQMRPGEKRDIAREFVARLLALNPKAALNPDGPRGSDQTSWERVTIGDKVVRIPKVD